MCISTCLFVFTSYGFPTVWKVLSSQRKQNCKLFSTMLGRNVQASKKANAICWGGQWACKNPASHSLILVVCKRMGT